MPPLLYELFCLAKPGLPKGQLGAMINLAGKKVLEGGGVLTDIKYFGDQPLAYEIRKTGAKYMEVSSPSGTTHLGNGPRIEAQAASMKASISHNIIAALCQGSLLAAAGHPSVSSAGLHVAGHICIQPACAL
jgi:hypothetical protein